MYMYACVPGREGERAKESVHLNKTFLKWKKMYGKEIGSERASNQSKETEKIRLLFSTRVRERESRGFSAAKNRERRSRWCCVCGRS